MDGPETRNFAEYFARIGEQLDRYVDGEYGDAMERQAEWSKALTGPLPERGVGADAVVDELQRVVVPNGMRLADRGFWGWVTVAPTTVPTVTSAASLIAAPQRYTLTAFNLLEEQSLDWLRDLCGLPVEMKGVYSSGGSTANLVALGAARQSTLEHAGIDPAAEGLDGARLAIYTSTEAHHTIHRAAAVLGIGRANVRLIATDREQRVDITALRERIAADVREGVRPVAVVVAAGTTNTGAIDPLREAGEIAREFGAWYHVDGAYGLPGTLDDRIEHLYDGLELADSAIVDPHKWLRAPVGIAATFVRDRSILHRTFTQEPAPYLEGSFAHPDEVESSIDTMGIPYADFALELSAPARGAVVWSILRELGREGVRAQVRQDNDFARRIAERARESDALELLAEPVLSICCFRYARDGVADLDALNAAIVRRLVRETPYLPSSTIVNGNFAIRPCFINARTRAEDVEGLADAVVRIGDEIAVAVPSRV
jgi:aromatic-L-amino-acid decarboxylase